MRYAAAVKPVDRDTAMPNLAILLMPVELSLNLINNGIVTTINIIMKLHTIVSISLCTASQGECFAIASTTNCSCNAAIKILVTRHPNIRIAANPMNSISLSNYPGSRSALDNRALVILTNK